MAERPIIFSGEMVRAILDGRKTQTRRVIREKDQPEAGKQSDEFAREALLKYTRYPYAPGDVLWVRETWRTAECIAGDAPAGRRKLTGSYTGIFRPRKLDHSARLDKGIIIYRADGDLEPRGWKPSIHMPRWACRLFLEVLSVRVERVQEISEADAIAEGIEQVRPGCFGYRDYEDGDIGATFESWRSFSTLWETINAKKGYGWDANPWVWVIEFKRRAADG